MERGGDPGVVARRGGRRKGSGKRADGSAPWPLRAVQALADGSRWAIVQYLSEREATVGTVARVLGLSVACTSKHLSILHAGGLVEIRRFGREARCRLAPPGSPAADLLFALGVSPMPTPNRVTEDRVAPEEIPVESRVAWRGAAPELEPIRRSPIVRYRSNDLDDDLL